MFTFAKQLTGIYLVDDPSKCETKTEDGKLAVSCAGAVLETLPQSFDSNIEILDASGTSLKSLNEHDFERYKNLVELRLYNLPIETFHSNIFSPLHHLKILNISRTPLSGVALQFPSTITHLYANSIHKGPALFPHEFSKLQNLKELSLKRNTIKSVVNLKLNPMAPLVSLNLLKNEIHDWRYDLLAPFCQLKYLGIDSSSLWDKPSNECCAIKMWLDDHSIISELNCTFPGKGVRCDKNKQEIASEALRVHYECLERMEDPQVSRFFDFFLQVVLILALILAICYLIYKYYNSRAVVEHRQSYKVERDDSGTEEEQ